jgi:hypothetical protein
MTERTSSETETFTPQDAWDELVHKDDRTSPEDYPDHCLISFDELQDLMLRGHAQRPAVSEADVIIVAARLRGLNALKDDYGQIQHEKVRKALEALSDTSTVGNSQSERCPTCKETDAAYRYAPPFRRCNDPWHADAHLRARSQSSPTPETLNEQ